MTKYCDGASIACPHPEDCTISCDSITPQADRFICADYAMMFAVWAIVCTAACAVIGALLSVFVWQML